jgi:flagellar protein FliL
MKKIILLSVLGLFLVTGGVVGTLFFTGAFSSKAVADGAAEEDVADQEPKEPEGPPIYISLDPAFTVTFADMSKAQFLQVQIDVMTHDPEVQETIKTNMPAVRNGLVMLFSSQKAADLQSREGKEKLREEALKEIQRIVQGYTGKPGVDQVFFTSFLMQ